MAKKWLNNYMEKGGKYPQVGPRDWMNAHGWIAKEGGPYTQGVDPVSAPGYQDYGPMYALPTMGLFEHMPDMSGMNNPTNLMKTNYNGFSGGSMGNNTSPPQVQPIRPQQDNWHENGYNNYSIDAIRMKGGGKAGKQLPVKYVDNPHALELQRYNDSLNLYNAYKMQDSLMGSGSKFISSGSGNWDMKTLKEARIKKPYKDYGNLSDDFQSEKEQFKDGYGFIKDGYGFTYRREDKKLIDYYKSLPFNGKTDIMYHSSPDLIHESIKPIGTYFDGTAESPIYKQPIQPIQYQRQQQENIQPLSYTGQPTDIPQQQMQQREMDYFNPQQGQWQSPNVVNGKLVNPAGFYKMQKGGKIDGPRKDVPKVMINPQAEDQRSHYDQFTGKMYLTPDQYNNPDVYNHESFHEFQDRMGRLSVPQEWELPLKKPSIVHNDDIKNEYYNTQGLDADAIGYKFVNRHPDFQFVPKDVIYDRHIDDEQYRQPWTVEGEAQQYENYMHNKQYGGKLVQPAGFYKQGNQYKKGGKWLENYK